MSNAYIQWVRKQPCCVCGMPGPSHAHHHTNGPTFAPDSPRPEKSIGVKRGKSQKADDWYTLPVCHKCHRKLHDFAGKFREYNGTQRDVWQDEQVRRHHAQFDAEHGNAEASPARVLAPVQPQAHGFDPVSAAHEFCSVYELGPQIRHDLERLLRLAIKAGRAA
jgi:hypothetical protein